MQHVKTVFRSRGFTYTQLKREGLAALYEQCSPGGTPAYEVVHLLVSPAQDILGKPYPEREVYPNDEQWGKRGWTYSRLDKAEAAFARLVSRLTHREWVRVGDPDAERLDTEVTEGDDKGC